MSLFIASFLWIIDARAGDGAHARNPAVAAVGDSFASLREPETTGSLPKGEGLSDQKPSGGFAGLLNAGRITKRASAPTACVPEALKTVLAAVADRFGPVSIESTHRSRAHNRRAGGARASMHLSCRAVDFRVKAPSRGVLAFLRSHPVVGGAKVYRNGIIHVDDGERRNW